MELSNEITCLNYVMPFAHLFWDVRGRGEVVRKIAKSERPDVSERTKIPKRVPRL